MWLVGARFQSNVLVLDPSVNPQLCDCNAGDSRHRAYFEGCYLEECRESVSSGSFTPTKAIAQDAGYDFQTSVVVEWDLCNLECLEQVCGRAMCLPLAECP